MAKQILEGTWEEMLQRSSELSGRRVRVTVLDEPGIPVTLDHALTKLLEDAEGLSAQLPPISDRSSSETWMDGVVEKFRRQGFEL